MLEPKGDLTIQGVFIPKCTVCAFVGAFKRRTSRPGLCWCTAYNLQWESGIFGCIEFARATDEDIKARIVQLNEHGGYGEPPGGWREEDG